MKVAGGWVAGMCISSIYRGVGVFFMEETKCDVVAPTLAAAYEADPHFNGALREMGKRFPVFGWVWIFGFWGVRSVLPSTPHPMSNDTTNYSYCELYYGMLFYLLVNHR